MALRYYDPSEIIIVAGGFLIQGTPPEQRIRFKFPQRFNKFVGSQGEVARARNADTSCTVEIPVLQTSDGNTFLQALHSADLTAPNGVPFPFLMKQITGVSIIVAPGAWITKIPDVDYGGLPGVNVWQIDCGEALSALGGVINAPAA